MTAFQTFLLAYLNGSPLKVAGMMLRPDEIRRDARLAEQIYWKVVTA